MPGSACTDIPRMFNIIQNEVLTIAKEKGYNTETIGLKTQTQFNII
jgi:hypothetical protein